ncbi:MAG: hypothetical protein ACYCS7_12970 [Acidimicrobiales bacterium]
MATPNRVTLAMPNRTETTPLEALNFTSAAWRRAGRGDMVDLAAHATGRAVH